MARRLKIWTSLGAGLGAGLIAGSAVAFPVGDRTPGTPSGKHGLLLLADSSGGEGEGGTMGESDHSLAMLGIIQGHMLVAAKLYALGEMEQAKPHLKHPQDEIYKDLAPLLSAKSLPGFETELNAASAAAASNETADAIGAKVNTVLAAIKAHLPAKLEAHAAGDTIQDLVRAAAAEYGVAVKDGKIDNLHEYQDTWGIVEAAKLLIAGLSAQELADHPEEIAKIKAELDGLSGLWPDLTGKLPVDGKAEALHAAAARIEIATLAME